MRSERARAKRLIITGASIGAAVTVIVSLLMDVLYADALQGTWRDAISHDLSRLLSSDVPPDSLIVYAAFALVLLVLSSFGAALGVVFVFLISRFLKFLSS